MNPATRLGLLGGTFDPIHFGHLDAAEAAQTALELDRILLVPALDPPHRSNPPLASAYHRFALVSLAANGRPGWRMSDRELRREGPSYTWDTLGDLLADGWHPSQLFFILGADAFAEISTWHRFPAVLDRAHFVVVARPGATLDDAVARTPALRDRLAPPTPPPVNGPTRVLLLEAHTRDISSTLIRRRLADRKPIDDLVPGNVAWHIHAHQLYGAVDHLHGQDDGI